MPIDYEKLPFIPTINARVRHNQVKLLNLFDSNPGITCSELSAMYTQETGIPIAEGTCGAIIRKERDGFSGREAVDYTQQEVDLIVESVISGRKPSVIAEDISDRAVKGEAGFNVRNEQSVCYKIRDIQKRQSR